MRRNRKSQVIMEFLMSYGWALLAVSLGIGALMYFKVLDTSVFIPDKCQSTPGWTCISQPQKLLTNEERGTTGMIRQVVTINLGYNVGESGRSIAVSGFPSYCNPTEVAFCSQGTACSETLCGDSGKALVLEDGKSYVLCILCDGIEKKEKYKGSFTITYTNPYSAYPKTSVIEVSGS